MPRAAGAHVLDVGCGQGYVGAELVKKGCACHGDGPSDPGRSARENAVHSAGISIARNFPVNVSQFDQIFMLDIIEHLKRPEEFMDELRFATGCKRPEVIITTANIGFFATRLMLLTRPVQLREKRYLGRHPYPPLSPFVRCANCSGNPVTRFSRCAAFPRPFRRRSETISSAGSWSGLTRS